VRIDILERLADFIRPLLGWRANANTPAPAPKGSTGDGGFTVIPEMMSILGCSPEEVGHVLTALGFRVERRPVRHRPVEPQAPGPAGSKQEAEPQAEIALPNSGGDAASPPAPAPATAEVSTAPSVAESPVPAASPATASEPGDAGALTESQVAVGEEVKFEEVWRPRRHRERGHRDHRPSRGERPEHDRKRERPQAGASGERRQPQRPGAGKDGNRDRDRSQRPKRRPGDDRRRRDEGPPPQIRASGAIKRAEADPDSPFAALGALKQALEKRAEDQGSS
jgi:ATP-dependent RNA helicase SUPV3L1/SUV3